MTRVKLVAAKVFVGIICAVLILGLIFMGAMLLVFRNGGSSEEKLTTSYDNLPNIMGDDGVYVAKNFFIENNLEIPEYVSFGSVRRSKSNSVYIKGKNAFYEGRAKEVSYYLTSDSQEKNEKEKISVGISCDPKDLDALQNKQKYNGLTYGLTMRETIKQEDSELINTYYCYTLNFKRNENTSKKCQLSLAVRIEHSKEIPSAEYKETCDKLFYSLLDNIVYRNI